MMTFRNVLLAHIGIALGMGAGLLLNGCGDAEQLDDTDDAGIGQAEEPFQGELTTSFQYGTQTASSRQRCNRTSSGQVCAIPPAKTLSVCVHDVNFGGSGPTPFTAAQRDRIRTVVANIDSSQAAWSLPLDGAGTSDCLNRSPQAKINFYPGAVGSSGTGSNDIKDYGTSAFGGLVSLTEGSGVVGQYQNWTNCQVNVDIVDILAKGTTSTQDNNGIDHASGHGLLGCLGLGGRSDVSGSQFSKNVVNFNQVMGTLTTGESCSMSNYSTSLFPGEYRNATHCSVD